MDRLIITALLVTGVALGLVAIRTPVYTAKAQVEVRPLTMNPDPNAIYYIQQQMNTEAERVTSGAIPTAAYEKGAPEGSVREVDTSVVPNTAYLGHLMHPAEPSDAQACADAFAKAYVDSRVKLAKQIDNALAVPCKTPSTRRPPRPNATRHACSSC